jgi:hypothetical protein
MTRHDDIQRKKHPIAKGLLGGVTHFLHLVTDMEKHGVSEVVYQGERKEGIEDGRNVKVRYSCGIKVGLDDFPKDHKR